MQPHDALVIHGTIGYNDIPKVCHFIGSLSQCDLFICVMPHPNYSRSIIVENITADMCVLLKVTVSVCDFSILGSYTPSPKRRRKPSPHISAGRYHAGKGYYRYRTATGMPS